MAKNLYHSELVKMGPVLIKVNGDVRESKFKGKPPFISLIIEGEERLYTTENDECAEFFTDQKGRSFTIVAEGSREDAVITYVGEAPAEGASEAEEPPARRSAAKPKTNRPPARPPGRRNPPADAPATGTAPAQGEPANRPAAAPQGAQRPPAAPKETPEQRLSRAKAHANRVANVWLIAYSAGNFARQQVREQFGQELSETQFQACVSTIAVQLEKDGFHHQMPTGIIVIAPKPTAPASEGQQPTSDNDGASN